VSGSELASAGNRGGTVNPIICSTVNSEPADAILMDLEMPGTDLWEPVGTLKTDRDIPIIGMSAYALDSERGPSSSLWSPPFARRCHAEIVHPLC